MRVPKGVLRGLARLAAASKRNFSNYVLYVLESHAEEKLGKDTLRELDASDLTHADAGPSVDDLVAGETARRARLPNRTKRGAGSKPSASAGRQGRA